MPANLTPQYLEAEAEYKKAQTGEERLACLKKMFALLPKHKGTDKMQADLKAKMSEAREEADQEKKSAKKGGPSYRVPKQGAGQVILVGGPNSGKSMFVDKLTRATPQVAPYPFTTREPTIGMMPWEDAAVQLVDTPPITPDYLEGYLSSMVRAADACVLFVDLADDDGPFAAQAVLERLEGVKTVLVGTLPEDEEDVSLKHVKTLIAATKCDEPGANDRLEFAREMFADRFEIHPLDIETGTNLEDFRNRLYAYLNVIRVYTKKPGKPADMESPFTCPEGSTVQEFAELVHRDFADNLKSARLWGTGVFDGQSVQRDHVLHDKDVIELHA